MIVPTGLQLRFALLTPEWIEAITKLVSLTVRKELCLPQHNNLEDTEAGSPEIPAPDFLCASVVNWL
jgi:hypothetical protein